MFNTEMLKIIGSLQEIAEKWEERRKLEEALGIPTSKALTEQFIAEEVASKLAKQVLIDCNKAIGGYNGR